MHAYIFVLFVKILKHPEYDPVTNLNDIAVLKLQDPIELNENIQISCLPNRVDYPSEIGIPAYALGWGKLYENGPMAPKLQNVRFTIYDGSLCSNVYPDTPKNWNSQICAGNYSHTKIKCYMLGIKKVPVRNNRYFF